MKLKMIQKPKFSRLYLFILIILIQIPAKIWPQESDVSSFMNRAAQYYLGDKDEILMKINVWGFIQRPGQYLVPRNTDLISLISFAGGPKDGANLSTIRIIRDVKSFQGKNGNNGNHDKAQIISVDINRYLEKGESKVVPVLQAGDTVLLQPTFGNKVERFLGFGSVLGIIAAGASVVIIIDRLSR